MVSSSLPNIVLWLIGSALLVVGAGLLGFGIWPRRRGKTPHCRTCNYNLTGLTSDRCPECGTTLSSDAVVHGVRRRRPVLIALGATCLLLSTPLLYLPIRKIDWYQYRPTAWVISDLRLTNPGQVRKAVRELLQRLRRKALSRSQMDQLAAVCLEAQIADPPPPNVEQLVMFAETCRVNGVFTQAQERRFIRQMVALALRVRPTVTNGNRVPYAVEFSRRACPALTNVVMCEAIRIDRRHLPMAGMSRFSLSYGSWPRGVSGRTAYGEPGSWGGSLPAQDLGRHTLALRLHVRFGPALGTGPLPGWPYAPHRSHEFDVPLSATFEVLPASAPDTVRLVKNPSVREALRNCISPKDFTYGKAAEQFLAGFVFVERPPVSVAFDVLARVGGKEHPIGRVHTAKDRRGVQYCQEKIAEFLTRSSGIAIILRSSKQAAHESVDIFEAWEGELVFENVPVRAVRR